MEPVGNVIRIQPYLSVENLSSARAFATNFQAHGTFAIAAFEISVTIFRISSQISRW